MNPKQNHITRFRSAASRFIAACGLLLLTSFTLSGADLPWRRHTIDSSFEGADGVRLADINRDGLPDITTGWEEAGRIRVYLNPGRAESARPWPAVTVGEVASPEDAVFVDLDGDGAIDVVSGCEGQNRTMFIHWAPGDRSRLLDPTAWRTEAFPATAGKRMWMFALPLQVDGRNGVDLIVGSKGNGASVSWLQAAAKPRDVGAWTLHPVRDAGWIMSLFAADFDSDGDADILLSDRKGRRSGVFWLEHPGPEAAVRGERWREHPIGALDEEVMFVDFSDINGDGRRDVVAAAKPRKVIFLNQPPIPTAKWEQRVIELPGATGNAKAVRVADVDLDGRLDLVFSCEGADGMKSGVSWFKPGGGQTRESWIHHDISGSAGEKFDLIELLDLDGDGDLDVITCEEKDNLGVIWHENPIRNALPNTKSSR